MRCPKCGVAMNPHSERCPRCGTSAKLARPDGDTMTRVRRQIAVVRREPELPDPAYTDTSFSPVLKFDRPEDAAPQRQEENPAAHFEDPVFTPVDLNELMRTPSESEADERHRRFSAEIRSMVRNKEDDLLAAYYFEDGISDLERLRPEADAFDRRRNRVPELSDPPERTEPSAQPEEEEMSEAARRLNTFPEESGLDKAITLALDTVDRVRGAVGRFLQKTVVRRASALYRRFDAKTERWVNPLLDWRGAVRSGKQARQRADTPEERRRGRKIFWSICLAAVMGLLLTAVLAASLLTDSVIGKWVVSYDVSDKPNIIMEFKPGGTAVISVRSEDGWHIHKKGRYKTQRKNGYDMLTITYEDGSVSRLYYQIEGRSGTFTNVDTNTEVVYRLK